LVLDVLCAQNVLLAGYASGYARLWHVTSNRCMVSFKEESNQVLACDYRRDGRQFATAGKDYSIRLYDDEGKKLIKKLSGARRCCLLALRAGMESC
jgi:COMPASS component SWD3